MNENLSIDEIIRQAEEIRKKTVKKAQSALEEINTSAQEITQKEIEVPKLDPESIVIKTDNKPKKAEAPKNDSLEKTVIVDKKHLAQKEAPSSDDKTRAVSINDKTGVIADVKEIKKTKKSFFEAGQAQEPLFSKTPPEIIERPATIKSKSRFDKTCDLEEIPTIVAVDELEKTRISFSRQSDNEKASDTQEEEENCQIILEGFEDSTEDISKIDEELAEKQLKERRRDKVNKFRLFSPDDIDESRAQAKIVGNDYESEDETQGFFDKLNKSRDAVKITVIITTVITVILGLLTFLRDSSYLPSFLLESTPYFVTMLVLYAGLIAVNYKSFFRGFKLKNGINSDFPISVSALVVLIHTVLLIVDSDLLIDDGSPYTFAIGFAFFMSTVGKYTLLSRILENFDFLVSQKEKHTVETIYNEIDAAIISRGLLSGEANLKTSIKTDFSTKFLDIGCSDEPADFIAKTTGSVMLVLSLILFAVFSIINSSWHIGFNAAVCALCISVPCISLYNTNSALLGVSRALARKGAMINGFEGARVVDDANAIVIEAQDLFGPRSCEIHGIKTFNGAKADDVILKTAAVIINTKSPLASVFDDVIIGKQTILPEVDGIVYEDRLGTSAWIYKKKILVGTRELLIHHGVTVPKEEFEKKYTRKGRKILYLAVTGKLMAMFVVSYNARPELKKVLKRLEKNGITILVKSADPFINDESIAKLFSLPDGFVRVMNTSNARAFEKYSDMCVEKSPAYVVHNGSALGFASAMHGAGYLEEIKRLLCVLISFGCALGFGVVTLLCAIGGFNQLSAVSAVAFQAIWCIFMEIAVKIKRLGI